jgi:hypothetical protein
MQESFKHKFHILQIVVLNNKCLTIQEKNHFQKAFMRAQKSYLAFGNLAKKYRYKYGKKFEIDADLCFNKFDQLSSKIIISLIENNIVYRFRISDLINIINKALTNAPHFFAAPQKIKNPYTNLPFVLCNLYNIYFTLKKTNYSIPLLFQQYFLCNFDLDKFKNFNECYIRDRSIDNFMRDASIDDKYQYILRMFYTYNRFVYFKVDPYFSRTKLVNIFDKYLHFFLLAEYSLNPFVRDLNKSQLEYNITIFSQLNPDFGKRIFIRGDRITRDTYTFNDHVITSRDLIPPYYISTSQTLTPLDPLTTVRYTENGGGSDSTEELEGENSEYYNIRNNIMERNIQNNNPSTNSPPIPLPGSLFIPRTSSITPQNNTVLDYEESTQIEIRPPSINSSISTPPRPVARRRTAVDGVFHYSDVI